MAAFFFAGAGQVKGVIDSEFAFEDAVQAYDRITSDRFVPFPFFRLSTFYKFCLLVVFRAKGKVVVHVG